MSNTERPVTDQIIRSGETGKTERNDGDIISSASDSPQIISSSLSNEVVLKGIKYEIVKQIAKSGESEIYLVSLNKNHLIFKYYYSQFKPKDEILSKLTGLKHPYIISLIEHGYYQDRFFEISEFAQGGTLKETLPINFIVKFKEIVSETIEALDYCHSHGIIHRDVKPENIFYKTTDKKDIVIGDFGIASNVREGEEDILTSQARTNSYAAPELFSGIRGKTIIDKSVDYYALGITLLHLWIGRDPFTDIDEYSVMHIKSEGRIEFPENINKEVEKLIKGLITVNPHDRWAYDEVKRWLGGEDVKVNYKTIQFNYNPYSFGIIDGKQIVVINPKDLAYYLEKYPEKGEGHLYRNTIANWIRPVDQGLFNELMDIVEKDYPHDKSAGLAKAVYLLDTEKPFTVLNNVKLITQEDIALHFEKHFAYYEKDLQNRNASFFVFLEAKNYKDKADEYRGYFTKTNAEAALNALIFKLQGADKYLIDNYIIYQPEELLKVDDRTKIKVIDQLSNINSKLSLWIAVFESLQPAIDKWRVLKRYDNTTLRYALRQGFEFNGMVAINKTEFHSLFKTNFSGFSSNPDSINEANYWLVNYSDFSFYQLVIDYLKSENFSDSEFSNLFFYALTFYRDNAISIYQVVETLLPEIKNKAINNPSVFNYIIERLELNISGFWTSELKTKSVRFLDCLIDYLSFTEKNISSYPDFFRQLTFKLNEQIASGIRQDIEMIKGNEKKIESFRVKLYNAVVKMGEINADLPYIKRYRNELSIINKWHQSFSEKIAKEKEMKIDITNRKFEEILDKHKLDYKTKTQTKFNNGIMWNSFYGFISLLLLILTISNSFFIISYLRYLTGLVAIILSFSLCIKKRWDTIVYIIVLASAYLGWLIGKSIPIAAIYIVSIGLIILFGIRVSMISYDRKNSISEIKLDSSEQYALKQSLAEVDNFFLEKEAYEAFQETVRILSMEELQFAKEVSKIT
jgi:serine/threonine protein kinase